MITIELEQDEESEGAQNGSKPDNRRLVAVTQDSISEGRPSIYTRQFNLTDAAVFSDINQIIDLKFEDRMNETNLFYPYLTKKEEGMTETQAKNLIEGQIDSDALDFILIPYIDYKGIQESDFESIEDYRRFSIDLASGTDKNIVVAFHYSSQPVLRKDLADKVDFACMYVGMNFLNTYFDKFKSQVEAFITNSQFSVIGYGIPSKVGVHSTGELNQVSDWIPTLDMFYFSEKGVPIGGGGGSSETEWFTVPSQNEVKDVVELNQADIDGGETISQLFEEHPSEFSNRTPREILSDSELEQDYMESIIESWE